jgi:WD40 repeat protein
VKFSECGDYLVTCSDNKKIKIWDPSVYKLIQLIETHSNKVYKVRFTSDSEFLISISSDKTV